MFPCSAYDLENKVIGTVGAGRIGQRVLTRLQASLAAGLRIARLAANPNLIDQALETWQGLSGKLNK